MRKFIEEFEWCLETCFEKYEKQAPVLIPEVWMQYCEGLINKTAVCIALYQFQCDREAEDAAYRQVNVAAAMWECANMPLVSR